MFETETLQFRLVFRVCPREDAVMELLRGRVHNGIILLENGKSLPEGAAVNVSCEAVAPSPKGGKAKRVQFPLVHSEQPATLRLTAERISSIILS